MIFVLDIKSNKTWMSNWWMSDHWSYQRTKGKQGGYTVL